MNREKGYNRLTEMEALYEEYFSRLLLYAQTFLGNDEEAKDVVGEVFSTVWTQWERQGDVTTVKSTYLYTLTRNRCLDILKHRKVERNYAALVAATPRLDNEEEVADYERRIQQLQEAIGRLPEPGKTILECCYFRRMSYQETASHLQLSLVVVRKNMLKVFKILRKDLNVFKKKVQERPY